MSKITPFIKRMRTKGGTLYTFSSAVEDIGININERQNEVRMSNFALLDIPTVTAKSTSEDIIINKFNPYGIDGALKQNYSAANIKDGRIVVAESFQNYALNFETSLLAKSSYNPTLLQTVSERVFWKWLKETGAIRWVKDDNVEGYFKEEVDSDVTSGYNSVVKYIGEITAGSVRTDTFGTYNETFILLPTSHGQTDVWFDQKYDENYNSSMEIGAGGTNIYGRENYTQPHPDGLSFLAEYDVIDSSITTGTNGILEASTGATGYTPGWWYNMPGQGGLGDRFTTTNWYVTDASNLINDTSTLNYDLRIGGNKHFRRSNVDALTVEFGINNMRTLSGDPALTYEKLGNSSSVDDSFTFNAILLYYKVWDPTKDKILATNLLGVLFLEPASGSSSGYPTMNIEIPSLTKQQSNAAGFGSSYSFRVNVKSDNMIDDTQAIIQDESTSSQVMVENWGQVFDKLEKSLGILNAHTGTINYITEQYMNISSTQTQQNDTISDLQYQVNDVVTNKNISGTNDNIAMFQDGDDPLIDSSIYMRFGNVGVFTNNPQYDFHVAGDIKTEDITIENAIRDTSANVLLSYGSPLQLGASTNWRNINIYAGNQFPLMTIDGSNSVTVDSSLTVSGYSKLNNDTTITGDTSIVGEVNITGNLNVSGTLTTASSMGSWAFDTSGTMLILKYGDVSTFGFGTDGSISSLVSPGHIFG
jgi:hypothetical protein